MKYQKRLFLLVIICLGLLFFKPALADTNDLTEKPGILPTSKFYFLKTWSEWTRVNILTFDRDKKAELRLRFAEKRLAEMNELKEKGNLDEKQVEKLTSRYEKMIDKVEKHIERKKERGDKDVSTADKVSEKMVRHQNVLSKVRDNAPEPAKKMIDKAKEVSSRGEEKAMERLLEHGTEDKTNGRFTADKIERMIDELQKHIIQKEEKLNKWEQQGKDVSLSRQELDKTKDGLIQAKSYLTGQEYLKAYEMIKQSKRYLSGMEHLVDDLEKMPMIRKIKEEAQERELKQKVESRIKNEIKERLDNQR